MTYRHPLPSGDKLLRAQHEIDHPVRLHDEHGADARTVELAVGWRLELGDLLADELGRLVRVERLCRSRQAVRR